MKTTLCLIGLGGAAGSILRYLSSRFVAGKIDFLPGIWGTFAVNLVGCLLIGIVYGLSERYEWFSPQMRLFLATGFCGGYTTFSAFAYENVTLWQQGNYLVGFAYILISIAACLLATFAGIAVTKII
ncbi:MAG: fluoride efflux transporter CrcB [Candidatus Symbiothrix sp.]|jgi:CrcB protein|nr:fluoride efflux transporter CrcB [Candidatus Symbiothrix sp.]